VDERAIVSLPKVSSTIRARTAHVRSASLSLWLTRLVLIAVTGGSLLPTLYILAISFKGGESLYTSTLIPQTFTLENYSRLLAESKFSLWVRNSLILGIGAGLLSLLCATFGGYAFSRFHFRGRRHGILLLFIVQMLPSTVSIVAIFRMLHLAGLINITVPLVVSSVSSGNGGGTPERRAGAGAASGTRRGCRLGCGWPSRRAGRGADAFRGR